MEDSNLEITHIQELENKPVWHSPVIIRLDMKETAVTIRS